MASAAPCESDSAPALWCRLVGPGDVRQCRRPCHDGRRFCRLCASGAGVAHRSHAGSAIGIRPRATSRTTRTYRATRDRCGQKTRGYSCWSTMSGRNRGGSDRGKEGGEQRRAAEHDDRSKIGADVPRADLIEETGEQPRHGERTGKSQHEADRDQPQSLTNDEADDIGGPAPRARRTASSRVRCPTRYASTLKMPTAARTAATPANSPITCVRNRGYASVESNSSSMVSNLTGTVGFASCRSVRSVRRATARPMRFEPGWTASCPSPASMPRRSPAARVDSGPASGCRQQPRQSPSRAPCDWSPSEYAVQWATPLEKPCVPGSR